MVTWPCIFHYHIDERVRIPASSYCQNIASNIDLNDQDNLSHFFSRPSHQLRNIFEISIIIRIKAREIFRRCSIIIGCCNFWLFSFLLLFCFSLHLLLFVLFDIMGAMLWAPFSCKYYIGYKKLFLQDLY